MRVEHVDDALAQPGKELAAFDRLVAIGIALRVTIVNEHQVQIRAMPKLDAAHLAVAHHDKIQLAA